jgi:hypothetical protein
MVLPLCTLSERPLQPLTTGVVVGYEKAYMDALSVESEVSLDEERA